MCHIMQHPNLKHEFDEALADNAVVVYCKKACMKSTAIQSLVKDIDIHSIVTSISMVISLAVYTVVSCPQ